MYRIVCSKCGNAVTDTLHEPVVIRGYVECTACGGQAASEMAKLLNEVRELTGKVEIQTKQIEQLTRPTVIRNPESKQRRDIRVMKEGG